MASQLIYVDLDLQGNELINTKLEILGADPSFSAGDEGRVIYNTTDNVIKFNDGTAWVTVGDVAITTTTTAVVITEATPGVFTINVSNATGSVDGLMSAVDKTKLDASTSAITASTLVERDASSQINVNLIPTATTHATSKSYVDNLVGGIFWKAPVRAISYSGPVTLSGPQVVDGVSLVAGDTVLLTDQGGAGFPNPNINNGVYEVQAGAWTRRSDFGTGIDVSSFAIFAQEGTSYADTAWVCTNNTGSGVVGTDALDFVQFGNVAPSSYLAGNGLDLSGFTFSIEQASVASAKAGTLTSEVITPATLVDVVFTYNDAFIVGDWVGAGPYTLTYTSGTTTILRPKAVTVKDSTGDIVTVAVNVTGGTVVLTSNSTFPGSVDIDGPGN